MSIDLSHSSSAVITDVLAMATRPPFFSHTGVRGTCDSPRNIPDDQIKATAALGGLVRTFSDQLFDREGEGVCVGAGAF